MTVPQRSPMSTIRVLPRTPKADFGCIAGFAGSAAYVASKHGVVGLTRAAAKEVGDRNIRVNAGK
jgi:NAD(P)-dependent dehydrogenase (short-subunit alcohol dehydrogenase family)